MSATEWIIVSEDGLDSPDRKSRGYIRSYCRCHHDRRAPSISINIDNGFGHCFRCGDKYLIRELNPEAAINIERSQKEIANGVIKVRDPKYFKRASRLPTPRVLEAWQEEEISLLRLLKDSMASHIADERARAYITGRGLSLDTAQAFGLGYIPDVTLKGKYAGIAKWADHIIIPVYSPSEGLQFVGRCLKLWTPGMDEDQHKKLLEEADIRRYRKTYSGGWFNFAALETATHVTFVEGAFDALSLIEAGMLNTIAVIGTAINHEWIPARVTEVTIAFDGDQSGRDKSKLAQERLYIEGFDVNLCFVPDDDKGSDWSSRYRLHGKDGLSPLLQRTSSPEAQVQEEINIDNINLDTQEIVLIQHNLDPFEEEEEAMRQVRSLYRGERCQCGCRLKWYLGEVKCANCTPHRSWSDEDLELIVKSMRKTKE